MTEPAQPEARTGRKRKQKQRTGPLSAIPRGAAEQAYLDKRRLPAFVATAAGAVNMEAVAASLTGFCKLQSPLVSLLDAGSGPLEISVGTLCSGSEMYISSLPELQRAIRAGTGTEVRFRHAWSCEVARWKREWIWRNFAPPRIFSDAADLY